MYWKEKKERKEATVITTKLIFVLIALFSTKESNVECWRCTPRGIREFSFFLFRVHLFDHVHIFMHCYCQCKSYMLYTMYIDMCRVYILFIINTYLGLSIQYLFLHTICIVLTCILYVVGYWWVPYLFYTYSTCVHYSPTIPYPLPVFTFIYSVHVVLVISCMTIPV